MSYKKHLMELEKALEKIGEYRGASEVRKISKKIKTKKKWQDRDAKQHDQASMSKPTQKIYRRGPFGDRPCEAYKTLLQHYRGLKDLTEINKQLYYADAEIKNQCEIESNNLIQEEAKRRNVKISDIKKEYNDLRKGLVQLGTPRYPVKQELPQQAQGEADSDEEWWDDEDDEVSTNTTTTQPSEQKFEDPITGIFKNIQKSYFGKS